MNAPELDSKAKERTIRILTGAVEGALQAGHHELRRDLEVAIDYLDDAPVYIAHLEREVERLHKLAYFTIPIPKWLQRHKHDWLPLNATLYEVSGGGYMTKVTVQCQVEGCAKTKVKEHSGKLNKTEHIQALYPGHEIEIVTKKDCS